MYPAPFFSGSLLVGSGYESPTASASMTIT
jgi:hypothetical protein